MERTQPNARPEAPHHQSRSLARYGRAAASVEAQVRTWLGEIADRLEHNRPDEKLTDVARTAVLQATTMDPVLSRALRIAAPEIDAPISRREYAARLREIAGGSQ
ncbi:hypothetical protein ACFW91_25045 [Streptomyces asoensis]|uniref:hypothetical protein n=1 Tax=Streptomyces asoensis TaxID=249586 RepID=UPI0036B5C9F7